MIIEELLAKSENKTLEFKESTQALSGIIKTIIAFANTAGGTLVIGIQDKTKEIVGLGNPLIEEERLASAISDSISPLLVPDIAIHTYRNKELILIQVPHVAGPFYLKSAGPENGVLIRFGSTNRVVDREMLQVLRDYARNTYFDEKPCLKSQEDDLDWEIIKKIFQDADKKITAHHAQSISMLIQYGNKVYPSNGAAILFAKNHLQLFPEAMIRCARFLGEDKVTFLDQLEIETYLPLAIEEAIKFIRRNTTMAAQIGEVRRVDIPEYPPEAIREAIINAVVHADYAMRGSTITITIFDNRIEIANPGGLMLGLTLEKALNGFSRVRNRVIAKVFRELKLIEKWGTGLKRIQDACHKHGLESPLFEELSNHFRVTLYSKANRQPILKPWQQDIVRELKKKKRMSTQEAAQILEVTPRNARLKLKSLVDAGVVKKVGTSANDPHSGYVLVKK